MKQRYFYNPSNPATFTVQVALDIQADQIDVWSTVLTPEALAYLKIVVEAKNKALEEIGNTNPNSICRGVDLDSIVHNCANRLYREATEKGAES